MSKTQRLGPSLVQVYAARDFDVFMHPVQAGMLMFMPASFAAPE